ncbi:hypothetical protein HX045_12365 [Myroides odoratimimus]|uniref:hypothetical protein n=1 Tax=Myroides odoratimimus TaxID=76832 RepID=UPI0020974DA6|nr:hypothetical protein [Myroides odoratimimus]MCO7723286.1 hypothetical protein [Myroides odoratimimus]MDM1033586.1 hypothetical protein [Myroides odoratimimus]MDM1039288.1 hypothetical protein [Myroides odoratimimus]MDM1053511.1 hypothetical protein [Myroides odoratimimus]MDM1094336.1 hypothetical protein [Myroides odoratimimus]
MVQSQYSSRIIKLLLILLIIALVLFTLFYFMADDAQSGHIGFKSHYSFVGGVTLGLVLFVFSFSLTMTMVKDITIQENDILVRNLIGSKKKFYKPNTVCVLAHTKRVFLGTTEYIVLQEGEKSTKIFEFSYKNFEEIKQHLNIDVEGKRRE